MLGAGYDTMGWRLAPEFPNVNFFEIDHPATSFIKAEGVKEMGPSPNLRLIAEDLGKRRLFDVLSGNEAWSPRASTIIVAEGLLQYLAPGAVQDLFTQCASITTRSRMAFTYIPTRGDGRPDAGREPDWSCGFSKPAENHGFGVFGRKNLAGSWLHWAGKMPLS